MKTSYRFSFLAVLTVFVMLASACAPTAASPAAPSLSSGGGSQSQPSAVEFTGVVQAMNGNQWTINGQAVTVDPQAAAGTQFAVGDSVRVKGQVAPDGSVTASQVTAPGAPAGPSFSSGAGSSGLSKNGPTSASASNSSSSSTTSSSGTDANSNSADSNSNDSQSGEDQEITGTVEAINGNQITIDGVTYTVADGVDLSNIAVGDVVTIEVVTNADGTQTVTEVTPTDSVSDDDSNDNEDDDENSNDDEEDDDSDEDDDEGNSNSSNTNGGGGGDDDSGVRVDFYSNGG